MMNSLVNEKVRVNIFGKEYEMDPGGLTHLEASQLAAMVDQKMREISDKLRIVDTQKVAVLAALNIAFEMGQRGGDEPTLGAEEERKINDMIRSLEKVL